MVAYGPRMIVSLMLKRSRSSSFDMIVLEEKRKTASAWKPGKAKSQPKKSVTAKK